MHESVVDLVQTVSGAELCSKRAAALSTLGVHTLADLRLLSEAHLRTEAGFTLTETLKLKHQLAAESAADAPRATPTKVRKRQPSERESGPTEAKRASTQAMQNVMAGSDPATWVVTHTPQSRFTQQEISEISFLLSLSHDMLYELPWDSRSSSSARTSKSLFIGDRQCRTLQAVASHFGIRAHASVAPSRLRDFCCVSGLQARDHPCPARSPATSPPRPACKSALQAFLSTMFVCLRSSSRSRSHP